MPRAFDSKEDVVVFYINISKKPSKTILEVNFRWTVYACVQAVTFWDSVHRNRHHEI